MHWMTTLRHPFIEIVNVYDVLSCTQYCQHFIMIPVQTFKFVTTSYKEYKYKEKFVILPSIGNIAIKSSETRAVIYNCRYSSGQFNP